MGNLLSIFLRIKYLSWLGYANEILVVNQWENVPYIICDKSTQNITLATPINTLLTTPIIPTSPCLYSNGESVITRSGMKQVRFGFWITIILQLIFYYYFKGNFGLDFGLLAVLYATWRILTYIFLLIRAHKYK